MDLVDKVLHLRLLLRDDIHDLRIGRLIRNKVADADTIRVRLHIFRDNILEPVDEIRRSDIPEIVTNTLDEADAAATEDALVDLTAHHSPVADFNDIVRRRVILIGVLLTERLLLIFQRQGRQDLREDVEIADILAALE